MSPVPPTPTLQGHGVTVRPFHPADTAALGELATAKVGEFFSDKIFTPEAIDPYLRAGLADPTTQIFTIESGGEIVGSSRLFRIDMQSRNGEIGHTFYAERVWRTHVNTATKLLLLTHAFETLEFLRVQFVTDLRNERSQTAIARLGAVREGVMRENRVCWDGYIRSSVVFSILKAEWPDVRARLQDKLAASH
ncbi:MAG TPA: GNAT family protein [Fimbriimonadaceae bacterium]|nr:GNAT family protein [Fimbriimonadaceae bacterium]